MAFKMRTGTASEFGSGANMREGEIVNVKSGLNTEHGGAMYYSPRDGVPERVVTDVDQTIEADLNFTGTISKNGTALTPSAAEINRLSGVTDSIQGQIDALETSKQDALSSSFQTLATDAELASYGKVRTLTLRDFAPTSASFFSIPTGHRPHINSFALGRYYSGSAYYPCLVTISTTGAVSASYFNGSTASAISSGKVIATTSWIVA